MLVYHMFLVILCRIVKGHVLLDKEKAAQIVTIDWIDLDCLNR